MSESFKVIKKERPIYIVKLVEQTPFKVILKEEIKTQIVGDGGEF